MSAPPAKPNNEKRYERVLEHAHAGDCSAASVARKLGLSQAQVQSAQYALQRRGLLVKTSRGWELPS